MQVATNLSKIWGKRAIALENIGTPIVVLATLGMVVLPIPAFLLDVFFSFNIALSLLILLVSVYVNKPLDFAAFPTVLLIATLLRLALNVASTRVVLLEGHKGGDAAGQVIDAFGSVVIGGNLAVGLIVFMILMIINFAVVTKGAGRISEVSARFTLDAMPGKQMAIDADLNAGIIDQEQAKSRREEVTQEADFYGSMDGASKFVKGDAVAGLLILFINIIGGLIIGISQHDLSFAEAGEIYTLLTIGDGLVAQIPSLLLSIAAAIIVTRQNKDEKLGTQVTTQMVANPKALAVVAVIMTVMGLVPGMPHLAFIGFGVITGGWAWWLMKAEAKREEEKNNIPEDADIKANLNDQKDLDWDDVKPVDTIGLEVGYRLIPMVDKSQGGELLNRIKGVRKKLSQELGFLVPAVHIRDNLELPPNCYSINIMGVSNGEIEIFHDKELAINPGQVYGKIDGISTIDPAFGLPALWINPQQRDQAQTLGYTAVDSATVVATHLSQLLLNNAAQLLGYEEVQNLLDVLAKTHPKLVESLVPEILPLGVVVKVLKGLLHDNVPIRDIRSIVETMAEYGTKTQDPEVLISACRVSLRRMIVQDINGIDSELPVVTLAPELEQILHQSLQAAGSEGAGIEPGLAERMQTSLTEVAQNQELAGQPAILLTSGVLRSTLAKFVKYSIPSLRVLSYQEVPDDKQIRIVSVVGQ
ncbi:flagellar biosynthesis protein FlhA [Moritella viscosa]|uniref:Flagellar biosynthesis protein FlhA n=1 Tax=Moritella viscosa TaxID=80854 RepID=A0A090KBJ0_9GAMM|nr:flagellar biosynthesis protein FlhA [Moritella viscosa]CED61238.1 polar flagellar assembly protein FlhA [Moritella viscosa]SGY88112.1 Flagellar biosynthesis protein [Moritella viscosa]SGY91368.1 Flagellar biosynthesis protein [Moritella viscosa]SGY94416.1 Flagellar biosynthesis protein [Moritella viscosa]SGY94932.1 Flagellar biosynthesis protein [Moritella viscosa]